MNKQAFSILSLLLEKEKLSIHDLGILSNIPIIKLPPIVNYLIALGYVEIVPGYMSSNGLKEGSFPTLTAPLRITQSGISFYESELSKSKKHSISEIRAWATLAIALVAMIASVISVVLELFR